MIAVYYQEGVALKFQIFCKILTSISKLGFLLHSWSWSSVSSSASPRLQFWHIKAVLGFDGFCGLQLYATSPCSTLSCHYLGVPDWPGWWVQLAVPWFECSSWFVWSFPSASINFADIYLRLWDSPRLLPSSCSIARLPTWSLIVWRKSACPIWMTWKSASQPVPRWASLRL